MERGRERDLLPFRVLAIASDGQGLKSILKFGEQYPGLPLGVMLRDPAHDPESARELARMALDAHPPDNITLITNSCSVEGIVWRHLTSAEVRAGKGCSALCGCSVHSPEELRLAEQRGVRYVLYSPIFATPSKPGAIPVGIENLSVLCAGTSMPVFALGGITTPEQIRSCLEAGAFGVAGISLFTRGSRDVRLELARIFAES